MTQPLWTNWNAVAARFAGARRALIGCDYDGTLTPIVDRPDEAHLPPRVRKLLAQLGESPRVALVFVSGRACADLQARIGLSGAVYAGDHGMHVEGPWGVWPDPVAAAATGALQATAARLRRELAELPGSEVELKRYTLSVHYRGVPAADRAELAARVERTVATEAGAALTVRGGLCVWEVRPRGARHKGDALRQVVAWASPDVALYVGDDLTDEDAFAALAGQATVKVGPARPTAAAYAVDGPPDVELLLERLVELLAA